MLGRWSMDGWVSRGCAVATGLVLLGGCPAADVTGEGDGSSSGGNVDTTSTSSPTTTVDPDTGTGNTATSTSMGTVGTSSESGESPTTSTDSTGGESTGGGLCQVDLPPPEQCPFPAPPGDGKVAAPAAPAAPGYEVDDLLDDEIGGGGFIMPPDVGAPSECDTYTQDCAFGEKCMPWANDGGNAWNATRCSPIDPNPVEVGEACVVEGSGVSGIDNCVLGAMCWGVDTETNEGVCVELCSCDPSFPVCNTPDTACTVSNGGVLAVCLPACNPLDANACAQGEGCYPVNDLFQCAPDASGASGAVGDECAFINTCDAGNFCANADAVPNCQGDPGCCSALCIIGDDGSCEPGQECVPWYQEGQAPDACLGMVGACTVP